MTEEQLQSMQFQHAVKDTTGGNCKVQGKDYRLTGDIPIIDQGQEFISGYTDVGNAYNGDLPIVIFGDHARALKYVDFPFALGADGVKVLTPLNGLNAKFLYYYLRSIKLPTFMRDQRTDQRIRARGGDGAMPSLEHLIEPEVVVRPGQAADLLAAFGKAKTTAAQEPPDLLAAFSRAAKSQDGGGSGEGASSALERARPPDPIKPDGPEKGRSRGQ